MRTIMVDGISVSAEHFAELEKRKDILLIREGPSIYRTKKQNKPPEEELKKSDTKYPSHVLKGMVAENKPPEGIPEITVINEKEETEQMSEKGQELFLDKKHITEEELEEKKKEKNVKIIQEKPNSYKTLKRMHG
jgi:hypothetical protein